MNNKGLTLIELITTFALSAVIIVLLINVVVSIRNVYSRVSIKSDLYITQSNLSNILNFKLHDDQLDGYELCNDSTFCYNFSLVNGETLKLIVEENKITVGDQVYKLTGKTRVVNPTLSVEYIELNEEYNGNNILVLKIPIINELYPNIDFGVNLVHLYNIN
ncbi:MAG: hypothetical protein IJE04_03130 [Bacilli bacterium]|nr:hypothetical protein [Bacilli bacterium]